MRLKRIREGRYEGHLSPYRVTMVTRAARRRSTWADLRVTRVKLYYQVSLWLVKGTYLTGTHKYKPETLKEAKELAVRVWLERRCWWLYEEAKNRVGDVKELYELWGEIHRGLRGEKEADLLAPALFRDWLSDHGMEEVFQSAIVAVGKREKVYWPKGWEEIGR